jgi:drug/metabolite transporter (DMT)-like permease
MTVVGVLVLTPDTLLIRLAATDHWTLVFWRGALMSVALFLVILWQYRNGVGQAFMRIGKTGLVVGLFYGLSSIFFVSAVTYTGVANTLIIVASAPMFAAVLGWFILRETVPFRTVLAIIATFVGILVVVGGDMGENSLIGDLLALGTAIVMAGIFVLVRRAKTVNMIPATAIGGVIAAIASLVFGVSTPFVLGSEQIIWVLIMGIVVLPVSFGLLTLGPRYIPAPEVGLILLLETALGPLWVWLVLDEGVSLQVFVGGAVVVLALTLHSVRTLQQNMKNRRQPA